MGTDVTHLVSMLGGAPAWIDTQFDEIVINGECVTLNDVENYRNYVSGALGLDSLLSSATVTSDLLLMTGLCTN